VATTPAEVWRFALSWQQILVTLTDRRPLSVLPCRAGRGPVTSSPQCRITAGWSPSWLRVRNGRTG
jgi:hypothetical protein